MQVHETNLKQLVQGEKQFRVPLWQRQYTWQIADHRLLWRDILEQYRQASEAALLLGRGISSAALSCRRFHRRQVMWPRS